MHRLLRNPLSAAAPACQGPPVPETFYGRARLNSKTAPGAILPDRLGAAFGEDIPVPDCYGLLKHQAETGTRRQADGST